MKRSLQSAALVFSVLAFCYTAFVALAYLVPRLVSYDDAFFFIGMWAVPVSSLSVVVYSLVCARGNRIPFLLKAVSIAAILFWAVFLLLVFWIDLPNVDAVFRYQSFLLSLLLLVWIAFWTKIQLKAENLKG